jgi:hypothetical protein
MRYDTSALEGRPDDEPPHAEVPSVGRSVTKPEFEIVKKPIESIVLLRAMNGREMERAGQ